MFDKLLEVLKGPDQLDRYRIIMAMILQYLQYINTIYPKDCPEKQEVCDVVCKIMQEYKN